MNPEEMCLLKPSNILQIDNSARRLGVRVVYSFTWGCEVGGIEPSTLDKVVERISSRVKNEMNIEVLRSNQIIRAYRDFYWRIGIDPTKTRPSSEALIRRTIRENFPRINPVVDAGNLASIETLVSIGLYDASKVNYPCRLTMSRGGELFKPIGGGLKELEPNIPILVDSSNRVIHVYPHRDSAETCVTNETKIVWVVAALVPNIPVNTGIESVKKVLEYTSMFKWSKCREIYIVD